MKTLGFLLCAVCVVVACSAYDQPCACGGKWTVPSTGTVASNLSTVPHLRGDHCVCRCDGAGEERLMPPFERECKAFEVACTKDDGRAARFVCE